MCADDAFRAVRLTSRQPLQSWMKYLKQHGYVNDLNADRLHHEIYLSDARKVAPEKWKTVIRHPVKKLKNFTLI